MTSSKKYAPTEEEMAFARDSMPIVVKKSEKQSKFAPTSEEMAFAVASMTEPENGELPLYKSYQSSIGKGLSKFVKGTAETVRGLIAPSGLEEDLQTAFLRPKEKEEIQKRTAPTTEQEQEEFQQELENRFPSNEGAIETFLEKGSEIGPSVLMGAGSLASKAIRTGASAGLGTIAKEAGIGETGQTLIEMATLAAPSGRKNLVGKNLQEQKMIDFAKNAGLIEEEIVPGLKKEGMWNKFLAKFADTGKGTQAQLKKSKSAIGNIYNTLKESPEAFKKMDSKYFAPMMDEYTRAFKQTPPSVRKKLLPSFVDLMKSKGKGEDFITFYQHANHDAGKSVKQIGKIQNVTKKAIKQISPELGNEFELTNDLYSNMTKIRERLAPPDLDMSKITKGIATMYGLFSGDYTALKHVLKYVGAQKLAKTLLLNPRFQNPLIKTANAIRNRQFALAKKSFEEFRDQISNSDPEFKDIISEKDFEEYFKYYSNKKDD